MSMKTAESPSYSLKARRSLHRRNPKATASKRFIHSCHDHASDALFHLLAPILN